MLLGGALVVAALLLLWVNEREADGAYSTAQAMLVEVVDEIETRSVLLAQASAAPDTDCLTESEIDAASGEKNGAVMDGLCGLYVDPYDGELTVVTINGNDYVGYISVPKLSIELPVLSEWSYPKLRNAPCRYSGSTKTDDLVILAHNYARHFGKLKELKPGDEVIFTDMNGIATEYLVVELETLSPYDVSEMTSGEYDLTLFTCTYGGRSRVTVRCDRKN